MFDLELFAPDAEGLVPMQFGKVRGTIRQSDTSDSLAFAPAAASVDPSQPGDFPDSGACGERFDLRNFAQDLEAHGRSVRMLFLAYARSLAN
jgi:hypothetical protein